MKEQDITQEHIDENIANTDEFWATFHKSLSAPYSFYNKYKDTSLDEWKNLVLNDSILISNLNFLFNYPILKGEYFLAYFSGFILTNYRLIINDKNSGIPVIPLESIISYNAEENGEIIYEIYNNRKTLEYSEFLDDAIVNSAKERCLKKPLNEIQKELLISNFFELENSHPNLNIPKIKIEASHTKLIDNQNKSDRKITFKQHLYSLGVGIGVYWLLGIMVWSEDYNQLKAQGYSISQAEEYSDFPDLFSFGLQVIIPVYLVSIFLFFRGKK
jgi:hypothetical protein